MGRGGGAEGDGKRGDEEVREEFGRGEGETGTEMEMVIYWKRSRGRP